MNPSENELTAAEREMLDRLADGELPDAERRELLAKLDRVPGGWRACALGFLEAQCFQDALRGVARESTRPPQTQTVVASPRRHGAWARHIQTALAMAASFLVALGIGWWAGAFWGGPGDALPGPEANFASTAGGPGLGVPDHPGGPLRQIEPSSQAPTMAVALPGSQDRGDEMNLPVAERDRVDHSLLFPDAAAFPADLREALRRSGYEVRQSRDLLPVPVQGGRHAVLPVDELDIHYVGSHVE
jgi:hypothetical protein